MNHQLRFARYAAVSTREQLRPGKYSLQNQLQASLAAAASLGWRETAGPFIVEGQSRETYIDLSEAEREIPPLHAMLQSARAGKFDILVAAETDRFRGLLLQVFRRLAQYRVQLYFLNLPIDPDPPDQYDLYKADRVHMLLTMSQMTSSLEIARTRRKWFENMPKRITELGLPATAPPWGYTTPPASRSDPKPVPVPDPLLVPHLIHIKDMLLAGHSTRQISAHLQNSPLSPPRGAQWHSQTVRDILRNPFYAGIVRFGVTRSVLDPRTDRKKRDRTPDPSRLKQAQGRHKPLWDMDTHRRILAELKRRSRNYRGRANNQFTGLLKCGVCGASLWRQGNGPRGKYRLIWRCSSNGSARGHVDIPHLILLEKIARELSKQVPLNSQHSGGRGAAAGGSAGGSLKANGQPLTANSQQLKSLELQLSRLEDAYLAGQWDLPRYTERKARIDAEIQHIQQRALEAETSAFNRAQLDHAFAELRAIPDLHAWFTESDPAEVNARLHYLIDHITVSPQGIKIALK